jgi:phage terminase large subunit GpA-like protein
MSKVKAIPGSYDELKEVLDMAFKRASEGKGKERHANDKPFIEQDIITEQEFLGQYPVIFQIRKKAKETLRLKSNEAKINEYLDIIVYAAAAVIVLQD